jgi:hypothetical protein
MFPKTKGMFGLWPKVTLPIFWAWPKLWSLFGWLPIIWHANGYLPNLISSVFLPMLANLWATKRSTKILASQIFGGAIMGKNQTYPNSGTTGG